MSVDIVKEDKIVNRSLIGRNSQMIDLFKLNSEILVKSQNITNSLSPVGFI